MINEQTISKLKQLPLFNISLSSKELFHSNFIAWLVEEYPNHMNTLFSNLLKKEIVIDLDNENRGKVDREQRNRDLTIYLENNKKIIIENKVKSLPDYNQLKEYSTDENTYYIILSLIKPDWLGGNAKKFIIDGTDVEWLFVNYETLSNELDKLNIKNHYVKDYIEFISLLSNLSNDFKIKPNKKVDYFQHNENGLSDYDLMNQIRIHDVYHKSKFYQLKTLLNERIKDKYKNKDIRTWNYFSNGTGAMDCGLILNEEPYLDLHFQLQDNNLKLYFTGHNLKNFIKEIPIKLLDVYYSILPEIIEKYNLKNKDVYPTNKPKDPLNYGLNSYGVITYYKRITLDNSLTTNQVLDIMEILLEHIVNSSKLQKELIKLNEK